MMMMIQKISPPCKRRKVSSVREFPQITTVKNERGEIGSSDDVAVKSETKEDLDCYENSKCVGVAAISDTKEDLDGCEDSKCVGVARHDYHIPKKAESFDSIMKKAGFNVAAANGNGKFAPAQRKLPLFSESKVKPLSSEEGIELMASQSKRRSCFGNFQRKPLVAKAVQKHRISPVKKKLSNPTALRVRANAVQKHRYSPAKKTLSNAHKPTQHRDERRLNQVGVNSVIQQNKIFRDLSPREKVVKVLRLFKLVFEEFDRDKTPRRGESKTAASRADFKTRNVLIESGMQLNRKKMIGEVPGIEVGDEYQYKAELNIIGLHFGMRGGIDYMKKRNMELATSIVSSEGNGYTDRCSSDVMFYCGEGGGHKDQKVIKDQKLVAGNLALANSMKEKTPVRVIRGERRWDNRGKDYVYDGLYMVHKYWPEKGPQGNTMFKFELRRVAGQPCVNF